MSSLAAGGLARASRKRLEQFEPGVQPVGVKVVDLLEPDLAGRHASAAAQSPHDVVEVVDVHPLCRPARQRRPVCRRLAAEVAQHQQTHRFAVVARTARCGRN